MRRTGADVDAVFFLSACLSRSTGATKAMIKKDDVARDLLVAPPRVINIGLEIFAANLVCQDAKVAHVRWSPPAGGNSELARLLEKLQGR
jgi:hypothetical protein